MQFCRAVLARRVPRILRWMVCTVKGKRHRSPEIILRFWSSSRVFNSIQIYYLDRAESSDKFTRIARSNGQFWLPIEKQKNLRDTLPWYVNEKQIKKYCKTKNTGQWSWEFHLKYRNFCQRSKMQHDHPKEAWVLGMLGLSFETRISKASSTDRARNNQATPMAKAQTIRKNWKLKCSCTPMPLAHRSTTESTKSLVLPLYRLFVVFFWGGGFKYCAQAVFRGSTRNVFRLTPCLPRASWADWYPGAKAHVLPQSHFASAYAPPLRSGGKMMMYGRVNKLASNLNGS